MRSNHDPLSNNEQIQMCRCKISGRNQPQIANNLPMPKACKEVFHPCAIETMHIIVLLVVTQFLTTKIWHGSMDAALVGAIMSTHFKFKELPMTT